MKCIIYGDLDKVEFEGKFKYEFVRGHNYFFYECDEGNGEIFRWLGIHKPTEYANLLKRIDGVFCRGLFPMAKNELSAKLLMTNLIIKSNLDRKVDEIVIKDCHNLSERIALEFSSARLALHRQGSGMYILRPIFNTNVTNPYELDWTKLQSKPLAIDFEEITKMFQECGQECRPYKVELNAWLKSAKKELEKHEKETPPTLSIKTFKKKKANIDFSF